MRADRAVWSPSSRLLAFVLAPALALATIGAVVLLPPVIAEAAGTPQPTASITPASGSVLLAGEDATFDVSVTNTSSDTDGYNASLALLVPNGIAFVSSGGMGAPTVYATGDTLPNSSIADPANLATVPSGYQLWVFSDVADLPAGAAYASTLTVRPDATVFPVGADPALDLSAYVSADARELPVFDGSAGKGGAAAAAGTQTATAATSAPVQALRLTKSEPSPEAELLRGVHDDPTTYTLTVEATPQGGTTGVTVVDYLPAGLEFLGCATVDNTQPSPLLTDGAGQPGGTDEYPQSGPIHTGAAAPDCLTPASVVTVDSGLPAGLPAGVYTKVTWDLPALSGGTPQQPDLSVAGTPSTYTITYRAAVPLFENTMDFVSTAGGIPSPASGEQAANLDNNNGASTRQGQGAGYGDGIAYTNVATASGAYTGALAPGTPTTVADSAQTTIDAMDLRILKSVDTHAGGTSDTFVTGGLATFTLDLATSEYASADGITLVDTIPNGLCPALPAGTPFTVIGGPFPSDCQSPTGTGASPTLTGATVDSIAYEASTGVFTMTMTVDPASIDAEHEAQVQYTVLMRQQYQTNSPWTGNVTSGDALTNHVELTGDTHGIPSLSGVTNGSGVDAAGDEGVGDDSSATIESTYSGIDKRVLDRGAVVPGASPSVETTCDVPSTSSGWSDDLAAAGSTPFVAGDYVCYSLTVDFASQIDVRDPKVTDFLPDDVAYVGAEVYAAETDSGIVVDAPAVAGQRIDWAIGTVGPDGDRYAPQSGKLVLHVLGRLTGASSHAALLDKPQNLMKYQQRNVLGDVYFERDAAGILLDSTPTLTKGIRSVDGVPSAGNAFDSQVTGRPVHAGSVVDYRIDVTAPQGATSGYTVWDALPAGITSSDVQAGSFSAATVDVAGGTATETAIPGSGFSATVVDPGDPGYPSDVASGYAGRSLVLWSIGAEVPGSDATTTRGLTLGYRLTIPAGAEISTDYTNTASIVDYQTDTDTGGHAVVVVDGGPLSTTPPAGEDIAIPAANTYDDATVTVPDATIAKALVGTEIGPAADPDNGAGEAAQGEYIDFDYSVTVPAHTSVANGALSDDGALSPSTSYTVDSACWSLDGGACIATGSGGFAFDASTGRLTFPSVYANTTGADQTFAVTLRIHLGDAGSTGTVLTNTARFASDTWSGTANASVAYVEPQPTLDKSASPSTNLVGGQTVTYTLKATNAAGAPKLYGDTVTDCVPASLGGVTLVGSPAGVTVGATGTSCTIAPSATANGTLITWQFNELAAGTPQQIQYQVTLPTDPAGSVSYKNTADLSGYTLPATLDPAHSRSGIRTATDSQTLSVAAASIVKSVDKASAPIGDTVTYSLTVTLPKNVQFYDTRITDTLPTGVAFGAVTGWTTTGAGAPAQVAPTQSGQTLTWDLGDIATSAEQRTVVIAFTATLTNAVSAGAPSNSSGLSWDLVNDDPTTKQTRTSTKSVTILNPVIAIDKTVDGQAAIVANPDQTFTYGVKLTNTGNTPAYNLQVSDVVPAGVMVDPSSISNGGTIAGQDATTGGGTITWDAADLPGPLSNVAGSNSLTVSYTGRLVDSAELHDTNLVNTASVTHYESFPAGGRSYPSSAPRDTATVDPAFPRLTLSKAASSTDPAGANAAYAGKPFPWTLTLVNTGQGPAQTISAQDVLPKNWTYDAGSAKISIGGAAPVPLADPGMTTTGGVQTLSWASAQLSASTPALPGTASGATAAQRTIVIAFDATPSDDALSDPGVDVHQTNTLSATTTDTSGATGNADGAYTGADATAYAVLGLVDLVLDKAAVGGTASNAWIPGQAAGGAYSQPQWRITVTNQGPDRSYGPYSYVDTATLPAGVTEGPMTARYYGSAADTTGIVLPVTGSGTAADPYAVGTTSTSLKPDGSDRIVLSADVAIAPSATGTATNTADVRGRTYEADTSNNGDTASTTLTPKADLVMDKSGPATPPNAGDPLSWVLTVTNDGPSDSVSTTANPITVTDTIPAGMSDVTLGTLPAGWTANGTAFSAGDTITLTLADGEVLTPAQSVQFVINGDVESSQPASTAITNTATVHAGATTDPDPGNDSDSASTTPTTDTALGIDKTRVVEEGSSWVPAISLTPVPPVTAGTPVTYLITVTNTGTADARDVTVVDQVPDYLAYTGFAPVSGTWSRTSTTAAMGDDQTFALSGSLAPGASASFRATLDVDPAHSTTVLNTAVADADNSTNQPSDTDSSDATRDADLSIAKTHTSPAPPAAVRAGETADYELTVTNHGPSDSSGPIVVTDTLPLGFSYASGTAVVSVAGGTAAPAAPTLGTSGGRQTLTWTIGSGSSSLANGATIVVTYTADVAATVTAGGYVNDVVVDGPDDNDPGDDRASDTVPVVESADLSIVKTADAGPYRAGDPVSYTVTVTNAGPSVARNVTVADTAPTGLTLTAMSGTGWTCDVATATCTMPELAVGTASFAVTASIAANVPDGTDLTNHVAATSSTPDPTTPVTDDATIRVTAEADLSLVKQAVDATGNPITTADAGSTVHYRLDVHNAGPSDAVGALTIIDTLPAGFSFAGIDAGGSAWSASVDPSDAQRVTFTRAAGLAGGADAEELTISVVIDPAQPVGSSVNTATVDSPTADPVPANNTGTAPIDVTQLADLSITKTHDASAVRIGDDLDFTIGVGNAGPSVATGVVVTDTIPAGLQYVDAAKSDPSWTVVAAPVAPDGTTSVTATLTGTLPVGVPAPALVLTTLVTVDAYPGVENAADVTATQPDPDPSNDEAHDPVTVPPQSALVITKDAVGAFQVGSDASYRITVTNAGTTEDPGPVVIDDQLPAGLTFRSASSGAASCAASGSDVRCTVTGALAVGATVEVTLTVHVGLAAYPTVTNTATVTTPSEQLPSAVPSATATATVLADPLAWTGVDQGALLTWLWVALILLVLGAAIVVVVRLRHRKA